MKNSMKKKTCQYFIKTFGCQMNHSDSERIAGFLELHKFVPAKNINKADLVVFNTCGVRQMAEDRVYGHIHNLSKSETRNAKRVTIILTGCLANRNDVQRRLKNKVDLFCEIKDFPKAIKKLLKCHLELVERSNLNKKVDSSTSLRYARNDTSYLSIKPKYSTPFSAYVPIMTGCNNFCSYCVVPHARGREVSRPANEIIREIKNLVKKGYKEIFLLGQNVNSYKDARINFPKLLQKINAIPCNFWIQFLSNHPKDVTDEMIEAVAQCQKVCECFHLPIQAGNDEVIRKMNRKYTAKQYLNLIRKIKSAYEKYKPDALYAITSDIIVGFPGETKKRFMDSAKVMQKVGYDMVFFGQYSPRPETAAWNMKDNISKKEKVRREKYINEILKKTAFENNKKYIGKVLEVLIDNHKNGFYFGRTRTMKNIKLESKENNLVGTFVKAKIIKANIWNLEGEIKKEER
jgi:tRNA-2-methylthio-N6-dimethylallyladenosine synthase